MPSPGRAPTRAGRAPVLRVVRGGERQCQTATGRPALPAPARVFAGVVARLVLGITSAALVFFGLARAGRAAPFPRTDAGVLVVAQPPRPTLPVRACALHAPVCVHAPNGLDPSAVTRVRDAFAGAWGLVIETLRVPRPLSDASAGGDPRLDVYVVEARGGAAVDLAVDLDDGLAVARGPLDLASDRDAAPAYLFVGEGLARAGGCALDAAAARGIVRASAAGLDAAETEVVVDGFARRMAEVVAPCPSLERERLEPFQAKPWRAMTASATGTAFFARTLDLQKGQGFAAITPAVLSMATNHHGVVLPAPDDELGPAHLHNDPSVFDVLAATLGDAGSSVDEVLLDYAAARALAPVPPAWEFVVPTSSLPRRFAIRRAIEPTGTTFFEIPIDATPKGDAVEIDLAWEQGARFVWRVLQIGRDGERLPDVKVPILETARTITIEARHLKGVKKLILVGVNVGDPKRPWRPDEPPSPPRGYEIGIYTGD